MGHIKDLKEVLDEVDRLKASTANFVRMVEGLIRERDKLRAEVERLKAGLACHCDGNYAWSPGDCPACRTLRGEDVRLEAQP